MKLPTQFLKASSLSTIFKLFLGFNLIIFNKIASSALSNDIFYSIIFFIHLLPTIIICNTFGLKILASKNQQLLKDGVKGYDNKYFFIISSFTTLITTSFFFYFVFYNYFSYQNYFLFLLFNLLMSYSQILISIMMGRKLFFIANLFGGIQLNGFLFGLILNLILFIFWRLDAIIHFTIFLNIILGIMVFLFFTLLAIYFNIKTPNKKPGKLCDLLTQGIYIYVKQMSDAASYNLDLIFVRFFLGEQIIYLYTTLSSIARILLIPKNIFSPILIPFIMQGIKKEKSNLDFLRMISTFGSFFSMIVFVTIYFFYENIFIFYNFDISLMSTGRNIFLALSVVNYTLVFTGHAELVLILKDREKTVFNITLLSTILFFIMLCINGQLFGLYGILISLLFFTFLKSFFALTILFKDYQLTTLPKIIP